MIKSAGGCYKLNVTEISNIYLPIDRTPTGFDHVPTVCREIEVRSRPCVSMFITVTWTKGPSELRSETDVIRGTFQDDYEFGWLT